MIRRRVRKDPAEEAKCDDVAALLISGRSGTDLEEDIKHKVEFADTNPKSKRVKRRGGEGAIAMSKSAIRAMRSQTRTSGSDGKSRGVSEVGTSESAGDSLLSTSITDDSFNPYMFDMPFGTAGLLPYPQPEDFAYDQAPPFSPTRQAFDFHSFDSYEHHLETTAYTTRSPGPIAADDHDDYLQYQPLSARGGLKTQYEMDEDGSLPMLSPSAHAL